MALKNYTTSISVEKTIGEIEQILAKHGAKKILKDYDAGGNIIAVSFMIDTPFGNMPIKLPMDAKAVGQVLKNDKKLHQRIRDDVNQARRVGWRIIKDWVDSQMAILDTQMVKIEEVFLPYAYDYITEKTFYQKLVDKQFKGLLLDNKKEDEPIEEEMKE